MRLGKDEKETEKKQLELKEDNYITAVHCKPGVGGEEGISRRGELSTKTNITDTLNEDW